MPVLVVVAIADEEWSDPAFKEMWGAMVDGGRQGREGRKSGEKENEEVRVAMPVRMVVEIVDEDWNDPTKGIRETMEHLCGLIGIADEDWEDPIFQEAWKELVQKEVPRVVKIEEVSRLVAPPPRYAKRRPLEP